MEALLSAKTEAQVLVLILIVMEDTHGEIRIMKVIEVLELS